MKPPSSKSQRNDTKIYAGTVTYSASTPVEVIVTHPINLTEAANATDFIPKPLTIPGRIPPYQYNMK
jgi:hypothetical protein